MGWQLALVHSTWITQPSFSKSELEVVQQATLFLMLSICHAHWSGPNWFELATGNQADADVMLRCMDWQLISLRCSCNVLWDWKVPLLGKNPVILDLLQCLCSECSQWWLPYICACLTTTKLHNVTLIMEFSLNGMKKVWIQWIG